MNINELQVKQGNVELTAKVKEKGDVREFNKFGKSGRVCNAIIEDNTGKVILTLWNEQAEMVNIGDTIQIENGYVGEYQGEKQLTTGKFGKLTVINGNTNPIPVQNQTLPSKKEELAPKDSKETLIKKDSQSEKRSINSYSIKVEEEFID